MFTAPRLPREHEWFAQARYGMFIHWGPYAMYGRGEQTLLRDHLCQAQYEQAACRWNPSAFDAAAWARLCKDAGMGYACLTARHHDGYCLWDSKLTDYTSMRQAPKRDFLREYTNALRAQGLRVGLYYSWLDWRVPAYFEGPAKDPAAWERMKAYLHGQVEELLTNYGRIDYFFFDGAWPRSMEELDSPGLVQKMRAWQPGILINNRLGSSERTDQSIEEAVGLRPDAGDFGTPEHHIIAENRLWESCQVSTWRLWGYAGGERWRSEAHLLDFLCECASKCGNLILNVGPDAEGRIPPQAQERLLGIGAWLWANGEAVRGNDGGDLTEFITHGWQTMKGDCLYLIFRFWEGAPELRVNDLRTPVRRATILGTGQELTVENREDGPILRGLPARSPDPLFPVIKLELSGPPATNEWGDYRNWQGDPARIAAWARRRGESVMVGR